MSRQRLLQLVVAAMWVVSFLVACGAPVTAPTSQVPAVVSTAEPAATTSAVEQSAVASTPELPTSTPEPAPDTPTPEPPPATPTPEPSTATLIPEPPTPMPTPVPPTPTSEVTATSEPSIAAPPGDTVQGQLVGIDSRNSIPDAYVLLCDVVDPDVADSECLLSSSLMAKTDSEGRFEIANVPQGMYMIVYGLAEDVEGSNQEWDGISVNYAVSVRDAAGEVTDPFGGSLGVKVAGSFTFSGQQIDVADGRAISGEFGLSIECRDGEPYPTLVLEEESMQILVEATVE